MIYVVGSGPAGVSCAYALVKKGLKVTMLDAGLELEPERRRALDELKNNTPEKWDASSLNSMKEMKLSVNFKGIPRKLVYGSDFPYRDTEKWIAVETRGVKALPSMARGGLSNVWGAAVLPYSTDDIADWPISVADLAPHYEAVLSFMNLAAIRDDLESIFPLYCDSCSPLRPSRQAKALMEDLERNRDLLRAEGFLFGHSRLAVRCHPDGDQPGCVYCGLCMYGCPYDLIYNSSHTVSELCRHDNFHYVKDIVVEKVTEDRDGVMVAAFSRQSGERLSFKGSRVYLGCGVIPTTKILLESLGAYEHPLMMRDSQWFLFPLVRYRKVSDVTREDLHSLAQVFIELTDPGLCEHTIHLQVYTYNDLYSAAIRNRLGSITRLLGLPLKELLGRLLMIQGYLHSNASSSIAITLRRHNGNKRVVLEARPNPTVRKVVKGIVSKLSKNRRYLSGAPIPLMLQIGEAGAGNHIGGTFPMKKDPDRFESDVLGRPVGFERVHVVDATTFPSIPATSITLTSMANAHRIASLHGEAYG